jgi:hypothetical protein
MARYFFLLMMMIAFSVNGKSQQTRTGNSNEQKRQVLKMTEKQYTAFSKGIREYNKRFMAIFRDKTMTMESKKEAFVKLNAERKAHIEKHLTKEQQQQLAGYEQRSPEAQRSHYLKQRKEREEQMKKKGLKVTSQ